MQSKTQKMNINLNRSLVENVLMDLWRKFGWFFPGKKAMKSTHVSQNLHEK
jgi:hypothetical protein